MSQKLSRTGWGIAFLVIVAVVVWGGLYAFKGGAGNSETKTAGNCSISDSLRTSLSKAAHGDMAAFQVIDTPSMVTEIGFNKADGTATTLADWKGRTVLLNLWATWCAPCRKEMPALDALEKALGSKTFQVVPVSLDLGDDVKPKKFYRQIEIENLPFFHDGTLNTLTNLKKRGLAFGLPATLLIDKRGCVLGALNGPAEWSGEDAQALIKAAM